MSKILHLTLKKKWFDMELSGEKTDEYRDIKGYWIDRLTYHDTFNFLDRIKRGDMNRFIYKKYDIIRATNGYGKNKPTFDIELKEIIVGCGNSQWGAYPQKIYFVLRLGKVLETRNIKNN